MLFFIRGKENVDPEAIWKEKERGKQGRRQPMGQGGGGQRGW